MVNKREILSAFTSSNSSSGKGDVGYDNPRENIDPHVKTQVLSSKEGTIEKVPVNNSDIANKLYVDNQISAITESDPLSWSIASNQTGLTGNKAGSFAIATTGNLSAGHTTIASGTNTKFTTSESSVVISGFTFQLPTLTPTGFESSFFGSLPGQGLIDYKLFCGDPSHTNDGVINLLGKTAIGGSYPVGTIAYDGLNGMKVTCPASGHFWSWAGLATSGGIKDGLDNLKRYYGAGNDTFITYTGTNWLFDIAVATTAVVFNESSFDTDFRIEGNNDANCFFLDAGNDRVGLGTATPSYKLDVKGQISSSGGYLINAAAGVGGTFTTVDGKTVTVSGGLIISIV